MNIDNGSIVLWNDLSDEQKESGRWVKLADGELAIAGEIRAHERPERLQEIFRKEFEDAIKREFGK